MDSARRDRQAPHRPVQISAFPDRYDQRIHRTTVACRQQPHDRAVDASGSAAAANPAIECGMVDSHGVLRSPDLRAGEWKAIRIRTSTCPRRTGRNCRSHSRRMPIPRTYCGCRAIISGGWTGVVPRRAADVSAQTSLHIVVEVVWLHVGVCGARPPMNVENVRFPRARPVRVGRAGEADDEGTDYSQDSQHASESEHRAPGIRCAHGYLRSLDGARSRPRCPLSVVDGLPR
jgi:hypothetical protein